MAQQYRITGIPPQARFLTGQGWIEAAAQTSDESTPVVTLIAERSFGVAPAGLAFEAQVSGWNVERPAEDLRYIWDFGDQNAEFGVLGDRVPKLWGRSANTGYLDKAIHTYAPEREDFADGQGGYLPELTYTVRCTVTDGTTSVEASLDVRIDNPDFVFVGSKTVIVALDGDFSKAPTCVLGRGYTWATSIPDTNDLVDRRVLLKRGETYPDTRMSFDKAGSHYMVGAWGEGPRPMLSSVESTILQTVYDSGRIGMGAEVSIWGLHLQSVWDPVTESWKQPVSAVESANGLTLNGGTDDYLTMHGCYIAGCHQGILSGGKKNPNQFIVISNTEITDWRNFGILLSGSRIFGLVGCRVEQNPNALGGGAVPQGLRGDNNNQNIHGPLRIGNPNPDGYSIVSMTEMRSNCGWSAGNGIAGPVLTDHIRPSHQPCIRFNTSTIDGAVLRVDRVVGEGGNAVFNATGFGSPDRLIPCDVIYDKVVAVSNVNNGGSSFGSEFTGYVLRNFLAVVPPAPNGWELRPTANVIGYGDTKGTYSAEALAGGIHIYNGTILDWSDMPKDISASKFADGLTADVIEANILVHAPNYPAPIDNSGSISFSRLFAPSYRGYRWENRHADDGATFVDVYGTVTSMTNNLAGVPDSPTLDTRFATPDTFDQNGVTVDTISLPRPLENALPADLGPGAKTALDDFYGRLRGPQPSIGAVEP